MPIISPLVILLRYALQLCIFHISDRFDQAAVELLALETDTVVELGILTC